MLTIQSVLLVVMAVVLGMRVSALGLVLTLLIAVTGVFMAAGFYAIVMLTKDDTA